MSESAVPITSLRLHPDAAKVPMPDASDLRALRDSLEENGQQDPLDVTGDGVILDGRTRWTLLTDLGAQSVRVRTADIPAAEQTRWIVERALARRHLTLAQKQALNALMRPLVVETVIVPKTGQIARVGLSQSARAEKLGVNRVTVQRWDQEDPGDANASPGPTHYRNSTGRLDTLHKPRAVSAPARAPRAMPVPLRRARPIPSWSRYFSTWCRNQARPEDHEFLRRLDRELHAALDRNGVVCEREERTA